VLKARVTDSNKAVQSLALDIVARVATGMGKPFDKQCRFFVVPVSAVLADQKAPIRASALQTLSAIANACETLEPMVPGIATALESANPLQRSSLLGWLVDWFKEHPPASGLDLSSWAAGVVGCLDDRNGDVRKAAQGLLPTLIACAGYDYVMQQTNSLKPASKSTAIPLIQAARSAAPAVPAKAPAAAAPTKSKAAPSKASVPAAQTQIPEEALLLPSAAVSKLTGVRRKLPQGSVPRPESRAETPVESTTPASRLHNKPGIGLKRPSVAIPASAKSPTPTVSSAMPLSGANPDTKKMRLAKDAQKWINESGPTRKDLADLLQHQMESHASKELLTALFSRDHNAVNDHVLGLTMLYDFFTAAESGDDRFGPLDEVRAVCIANSDLALKYVSMKAHEPQSNLVQKCLDVVESVIAFFQSTDYQITDAEALCFIPTMVHKVLLPVTCQFF
jgi:cytoskeleton-associated protein 5